MIEGVMKEGFITTSYDSVVNWAKTGSLVAHDVWPGLLCGRNDARRRCAL
jgi:NADH:ubiquinone oxidoreductase subunit B-like Fe-S oxidoreductase